MARTKKTVTEKVQAEFPEFANELGGASTDQLNSRLATLAKALEESESAKEEDEELERTQSLVAELTAPYKEVKKAVRLKTKYVIALLKEKGAA